MENNQYLYDVQEDSPPDRFNPFRNNTEYRNYYMDYRKIVPQIAMQNCELPEIPAENEKRKIRRCFNAVGFFMIGQVVAVNMLAIVVSMIVTMIITAVDHNHAALYADYNSILMDKMSNSSINIAVTGLCYMIVNLMVFIFGCRATGIEKSSLFGTENLGGKTMFIYIVIAIGLQMFSAVFSSVVAAPLFEVIFNVDIYSVLDDQNQITVSISKIAATVLYTCIIAPVTEELVLRGFVLKNLSRVNQRFGIIVSAFIFALMHENIPQFILAFIVGIFLGYVAVKHNSIVPTIILHMVVNTTNVIISIIAEINESVGNVIYAAWMLVFMISGLLLIIISAVKGKIGFPKPVQAQKQRGVPVMMTSAGLIILFVVHSVMTVIFMLIR